MKGRRVVQTLEKRRIEYNTSLDISADLNSLAVFIKPNFSDSIQFNKEAWQMILELPMTEVWDMLRDNLIEVDIPEDNLPLIRRKNEALAAEKYLKKELNAIRNSCS